jgi:hypothetical protein
MRSPCRRINAERLGVHGLCREYERQEEEHSHALASRHVCRYVCHCEPPLHSVVSLNNCLFVRRRYIMRVLVSARALKLPGRTQSRVFPGQAYGMIQIRSIGIVTRLNRVVRRMTPAT